MNTINPKAMAGDIPVYCSHDEIVDIMNVIPNPKNPNTHGERQIEILSQIIKAQGWRKPITVSKRSGFIVAGHGRLQAALLLQSEKVPVDYQDYATEAEEYADLVADNRISELSEIDHELLDSLLEEIREFEDFNFELTGYADYEIDSILEGLDDFNHDDATEAVEDDYEAELPEEPKSRPGEIYQLGNHRLMCGDSTNADNVEKLMNGITADITFTSPPYNAGTTPTELSMNKTAKYQNDDDNKSTEDYRQFLIDFTQNAMKHSHFTFVNIQSLANNKIALIEYMHELKEVYADTIIWDKMHSQPAMKENVLNSEFEYVHVFSKKAKRSIGTKKFRGTISNIVHIQRQNQNEYSKIHNATFPMDFASWFVSNFSTDSVLDLFGGSGTTMIVCEQLNKSCFMMEYDPKYVDVIIDRWEKFTGKKAVLLSDAA